MWCAHIFKAKIFGHRQIQRLVQGRIAGEIDRLIYGPAKIGSSCILYADIRHVPAFGRVRMGACACVQYTYVTNGQTSRQAGRQTDRPPCMHAYLRTLGVQVLPRHLERV